MTAETIPARLRALAIWIGRLLSAVALIAVLLYFVRLRVWRMIDLRDPRLYAALPTAVAIYAAGCVTVGYAWVRWLESASALVFPALAGVRIYFRSQIAKYVPGNFFHFVARHAAAGRLGAPHSALVLASAAETAALVMVAAALGALGGGLPARFPRVWIVAAAISAVVLAVPLAAKLGGVDRAQRTQARRWFDTLVTLLWYVPFFAAGGLCLALLLSLAHTGPSPSIARLVGIWSMSWLAGYLVPGSPGGLGVRDAALVFALSDWCGRPEAIVLAAEMRLVSTLADVALWLASPALDRPAAPGARRAWIYKTLT